MSIYFDDRRTYSIKLKLCNVTIMVIVTLHNFNFLKTNALNDPRTLSTTLSKVPPIDSQVPNLITLFSITSRFRVTQASLRQVPRTTTKIANTKRPALPNVCVSVLESKTTLCFGLRPTNF